jgi:hypothetical protein
MARYPFVKLIVVSCAVLLVACAAPGQPEVISSLPTADAEPTPLETLPAQPEDDVQADLMIEVDLTNVQGAVNPLGGLQGGPLPIVRGDADLTEWYQAGGVDHVRLPQDTLPNNLTLGGIFPAQYAPIGDPGSYDFQRIDRYVEGIIEAGAAPLWQATYDVGGGDILTEGDAGAQAGRTPTATSQWTGAIQHTLMHFNDGWSEGHAWQVRYVEFIHEPFTLGGCVADGFGLDMCWSLFEAFAEAINDYNEESGRDVQIVGPGVVVTAAELEIHKVQLGLLLDRLESDELDYLSFHPQGRTPLEQDAIAQELRRFLDSYGSGEFAHVGLWVSAWNSAGPGEDEDGARIAALDTATRILWQDTVDFATLYRADRWAQGPAEAADPETGQVNCAEITICEESLYFTPFGEPQVPFLPFLALAEISRETPERVAVTHPEQHRFPVMAARAADAGQLSVLIAAPNAIAQTYAVTLRGLPPGVGFQAEMFVVDNQTSTWEPRETITVEAASNGAITLNGQFSGPSIVYWRLESQ